MSSLNFESEIVQTGKELVLNSGEGGAKCTICHMNAGVANNLFPPNANLNSGVEEQVYIRPSITAQSAARKGSPWRNFFAGTSDHLIQIILYKSTHMIHFSNSCKGNQKYFVLIFNRRKS